MDDLMKQFEKTSKLEVYKRMFKYIIQWIIIALATSYLPSKQLKTSEIIIIATIGTISFAILDIYIPSVSC